MALVDIDDGLKARLQELVRRDRITYPSMKNFIDRVLKKELDRIESDDYEKR